MFEVGAGSHAEFGVELQHIGRTIGEHLVVVLGGDGAFVEVAVDLCHEEGESGLCVAVGGGVDGLVDVLDGLLVLLLRDGGFDHGDVKLVTLVAGEIAFGQPLNKLVEGGLGFLVALLHGHATGQEDGALVAGMGAGELLDENVASVGGGDVVVLVEGGIGRHEVALLDVGHVLHPFDEDAVLLYAFDAFLDGSVHLRIDGACHLVVADILGQEEARVVVDGGLAELGLAGLEALVAVPVDVVMAGEVVVLDVGPLGFFGGAGGQENEERETKNKASADAGRQLHAVLVIHPILHSTRLYTLKRKCIMSPSWTT